MQSILESHLRSGNFHHGYFLAGDFDVSRRMALEAASVLFGYAIAELKRHPDFYHQTFELFGIKESQQLKSKSSVKPLLGDKKVFIVELLSLTVESSNALLKLFEEPPEGTHFFIIIPSAEAIIPTLRSRLTVVNNSKIKENLEKEEICRKFLKALPNKRLDIINKIGKDKNQAIEFLNGLEVVIADELGDSISKWRLSLQEIQKSREFLLDRAPNVKMILERLALVLPQV